MYIQIDNDTYVNTDCIESIRGSAKSMTFIGLKNGENSYFEVTTPVQDILNSLAAIDKIILLRPEGTNE